MHEMWHSAYNENVTRNVTLEENCIYALSVRNTLMTLCLRPWYHMNIHAGKYKCTEYGICYPTTRDRTERRRSHSGEKPFECTVCSKRFIKSRDLVDHRRIIIVERNHIPVMNVGDVFRVIAICVII